jgi:hypothetical protein
MLLTLSFFHHSNQTLEILIIYIDRRDDQRHRSNNDVRNDDNTNDGCLIFLHDLFSLFENDKYSIDNYNSTFVDESFSFPKRNKYTENSDTNFKSAFKKIYNKIPRDYSSASNRIK